MKKSKKSNLIFILLIIFLILNLFLKFCVLKNDANLFGITILKVSSNSMFPTIKKDDYIVIKKQKDYEIGDIITFKSKEDCLITHRIIEKYENVFITKGDNNNISDDEQVKKDVIFGKVIYILKMGDIWSKYLFK